MIRFLKGLFHPKQALQCGGEVCWVCEDEYGREIARIFHRRPTSDEILNYVYYFQSVIANESNLRKIGSASDEAKEITDIIQSKMIEYGEKIFLRAEGFEVDGKRIEDLDTEEQLKAVTKYYGYYLRDIADAAHSRTGKIKKKH